MVTLHRALALNFLGLYNNISSSPNNYSSPKSVILILTGIFSIII